MDWWAKQRLIELVGGKNVSKKTKETLERDFDVRTREFAGPAPSPIELVLAETATLDWFALRVFEAAYASSSKAEEGLTIKQADFHLRRIERAHRRFMSSLKTLATVRRLALPALQINLASQQVNQMKAGG
jgi:hypothetical protein